MYLALMLCNFKQQFAYRASLYMRIFGNIIWVYIQVCIWQALLQAGISVEQTVEQLVTYTVVVFLIDMITHNDTAQKLAEKVKNGSISIDLIRPFPLKWYLFYQQLSENIFHLIFVGIPVSVISILLWTIVIPDVKDIFFGIISLILAVLLTFHFQYAIGLLVFWLKDVTYTKMITEGIVELFSGSLVPLWFYPEVFRQICMVLPFRFMVFEPISIILGNYMVGGCIRVIVIQIFWLIVLAVLGEFIWKKIQKNITIQGG